MEVLLATSILVGSVIVLVELANQGRRNSAAALFQAQAQVLCLTRLNEIELGLAPLLEQETTPLEETPGWSCTIEVQPEVSPGLTAVRVKVEQDESRIGKPQSFSLTRWLPSSPANDGETGPAREGQEPAVTRSEPAPFGREGGP